MPLPKDYYDLFGGDTTFKSPADEEYPGLYPSITRERQAEGDGNALWDFLGSGLGGFTSGMTWGATDLMGVTGREPWEEMTGAEKAGWILGEGASLFAPWGPFGLMAKGSKAVAKGLGNKFDAKRYRGIIKTNLKNAGKDGRVDFAYSGLYGDESGQTEFIDKWIAEKHGVTDGEGYTMEDGTVVKSNPKEFKRLYESLKNEDFSSNTEIGRKLEDYLVNTVEDSYNGAKTAVNKNDGGGGNYHDTSFGSVSKVRANNYVNKIKDSAKNVTDLRGNDWELREDGKYEHNSNPENDPNLEKNVKTIRSRTDMIDRMEMDAFYPGIYKGTFDPTFDPVE